MTPSVHQVDTIVHFISRFSYLPVWHCWYQYPSRLVEILKANQKSCMIIQNTSHHSKYVSLTAMQTVGHFYMVRWWSHFYWNWSYYIYFCFIQSSIAPKNDWRGYFLIDCRLSAQRDQLFVSWLLRAKETFSIRCKMLGIDTLVETMKK